MLNEITEWLTANQDLIQQIGNASLVMLVITVIALPIVVMKLPADYFISEKREPARQSRKHPLVWGVLTLVKNLLGLLLILVGIAMLVLPGQGTVTILIGLAISNFPGKYRLERRIASQPAVGATLNKIRELTGTPPLLMPEQGGE
ncbi:MAG: PGPGW domain-containing protein [Gammaproteobacteria bacterium]